ncbi:hypothetical protein Tco_0574135 [Tanacetum coccineum]
MENQKGTILDLLIGGKSEEDLKTMLFIDSGCSGKYGQETTDKLLILTVFKGGLCLCKMTLKGGKNLRKKDKTLRLHA